MNGPAKRYVHTITRLPNGVIRLEAWGAEHGNWPPPMPDKRHLRRNHTEE
jgi:hypothetical protein